jgi:hypothetical protein
MPDPFPLDLTAAQINTAVNAAYDSDRQPAAGQTTLCNGDKIAAAISSAVGAVVSDVSTLNGQVTALDGRVTALEASPSLAKAWFVGKTSSTQSTITVSSYSGGGTTDAGVISVNTTTGVMTVNTAGTYKISVNGSFSCTTTDSSSGYFIQLIGTSYSVGIGPSYGGYSSETTYTGGGSVVIAAGVSATFSLKLFHSPTSATCLYYNAGISIEQLA